METNRPVALITGAGRGIGRATAVELGRAGYRLGLISRTNSELRETASMSQVECELLSGDVGNPADVQRMVDQVLAKFGRVDALIHCAGAVHRGHLADLSSEQWREMLDTNLSAIYYFCRGLWGQWKELGSGVIVSVSSYAARDPFDGLGAYGAAKAGVNLLGTALSREGAEIGVRVHTVAPAATETRMFRSLFTHEQFATEKTLDPAAVARVIVQCVNGDLTCTSGEVIYVHKS
jgi:3-oxoacyl-[acyl-carrier protein] reductase